MASVLYIVLNLFCPVPVSTSACILADSGPHFVRAVCHVAPLPSLVVELGQVGEGNFGVKHLGPGAVGGKVKVEVVEMNPSK